MKKLLFSVFSIVAMLAFWAAPVHAQSVGVSVFFREGCAHCANEETFLDTLTKGDKDVTVTKYRLENPDERHVWDEFTTRLGLAKVTPITAVGTKYLVGFDRTETTGKEILSLIEAARKEGPVTDLSKVTGSAAQSTQTCDAEGLVPCAVDDGTSSYVVTLPIVGRLDVGKYPLLVVAAVLGFFDGFNPCAMWVLVTFLLILLQVGSRKRMVAFAGTFILAEAAMYTLILTVWYKTWDFVKLDSIIMPAVGALSIVGGILFIREWRKKELECKVTDLDTRHRTHKKIQELASGPFTILTVLGILGVAFSVNIVEFACSIGIPQAFTKILELNRVSPVMTAASIGMYILFYMLDDFLVFGLAFWGADKLALTGKYSRFTNLVGGILMLVLGLLMIFRPGWMVF